MRFNELTSEGIEPSAKAAIKGMRQLSGDQYYGLYKTMKDVAGHDGEKQTAPEGKTDHEVSDKPFAYAYTDEEKNMIKGVDPKAKQITSDKSEEVKEGYYDLNSDLPGMEPIDFSSNPSFKDLVTRYTQLVYQGHTSETDPEEDQEYDAIEHYVAQRFGEKGSAHLQKAAEVSYWGRDDGHGSGHIRSSNLGRPNQPGGNFRTTKAGKMHGQDAKVMKAKVADRLGRHPAPALPESMEEGNLYSMALQRYPQLKQVDRETVINALNGAYEDYLMHYGYEGIGPDEESSMIDHAVKGLNKGVAEADNNYHANRTGFARPSGQRDDERHDLDVARPTIYGLKINGKIWKKDGNTVTFFTKERALAARNSILAKRPELEVGLVQRPQD